MKMQMMNAYVLFGMLMASGGTVGAGEGMRCDRRPFLGINEDNDHYQLSISKNPAAITEADIRAYFDSVAGGGAVTHFFMCVNGQRTSYDSKVWEPIWLGVGDRNEYGQTNDRWCVTAKILHDRGLDPWKIWCARAREKGVSPWISMRMNDGHYVSMDYQVHRNETFWWTRRDLWRNPSGKASYHRVFDYSKPDVRAHALALVREIVSRWDLDGLELDWLRQPECLSPGKARSQSPILVEFLRDCRRETAAAAKRLGHPVGLSVRVPTLLEAAREWGFDVETWAREGLVDLIVVCNLWGAADYDIDVAGWRTAIAAANPNVRVVPGADICVASGAPKTCFQIDTDLALVRGWAASVAGASKGDYYLFNVPYFRPNVRNAIYRGELAPDRLFRERRRFLIGLHECVPRRALDGAQLPIAVKGDHTLKINAYSGKNDRWADVVVRLDGPVGKFPRVWLNGCGDSSAPVRLDVATVTPKSVPNAQAVRWRFPVAVLRQGMNEVRIVGKEQNDSTVAWVEIDLDPVSEKEKLK